MNLQNKIYGRLFATVGLIQDTVKNKPQYAIAPSGPGLHWTLNKSTLAGMNIDGTIIDDFLKALNKLGTVQSLRDKLGIQPRSHISIPGLVLKHPKRPDIMANIIIHPGPTSNAYNPNTYAMPYDLELHFYVDVDGIGPKEYRDGEEAFKYLNALSSNNLDSAYNIDQNEIVKTSKGEARNPTTAEGFENLYESIARR